MPVPNKNRQKRGNMKKLLAILLAVILVGVTSVGVAGSGEQLSAATCSVMLEKLYDLEEFEIMFNRRYTKAFVDSDGDVVIYFESRLSKSTLMSIEDTIVTFVCDIWTNFYEVHSLVSDAGLYVYIWDGSNLVYMTGGNTVIDYYDNIIPFVHNSNKI